MADNAENIKVHPIVVRGKTYEVTINSNGYFSVQIDKDRSIGGNTREELRRALMKASLRKDARVAVPFIVVKTGSKLRSGVASGFHAGTGKILVKWSDGTSDQLNSYEYEHYLVPLNPEELDRLQRLETNYRDAKATYDKFIQDHKLNLANEINRLTEEAANKIAADEAAAAKEAKE
jgi:hypothetical protein